MLSKTTLSTLSGLTFIIAFNPYIKAIVQGEAKPRKATWLVWATGDIIILIGMIAKHTVSGLLIAANLGALTVLVLALKFGESGWTRIDKVCITLSMLAITLWVWLGDSNFGISLSLLALWIAAWPTYLSAWKEPLNEDRKAWVLFNLANVLAVLAIPPERLFADVAPPFTFMFIDVPMLFLLFVRPRLRRPVEEVAPTV